MKTFPRIALAFVASGVAGYVGERVIAGRPRSVTGASYPFLPAYAFGGAAVSLLAPHLRGLPWWQRAVAYGVVLTGVEYAGCLTDRAANKGKEAWNYGEGPGGCTTWKHGLLWAGLGLGAEAVLKRVP